MDSNTPVEVQSPPPGMETEDINDLGSVSDEEGFVSGEEEFHFSSESPVGPICDHPFLDSTDILMSTVESVGLSEVKVDDENKKGENVLEGDGLGRLKRQSNGLHESVGDNALAATDSRDLKADKGGGFEGVGDAEVEGEDDNGKKLDNNGEKVVEVGNGVELENEEPNGAANVRLSGDATPVTKVPKEGTSGGDINDVKEYEVNHEDAGRAEEAKGDDLAVVAADHTDERNKEELNIVEPNVVEAGGVRLSPEVDSVVDAINADVRVPGVAVVGNIAELEPYKGQEELPVDVPVIEADNSDEMNPEELRSVESDLVEVDGVKLTPEGDSVVDAINADVKVPGIAVVGKNAESEHSKVEEEHPVVGASALAGRNGLLSGFVEDAIASKTDRVETHELTPAVENADLKPLNSVGAAAEVGGIEKMDIKGENHSSEVVPHAEMLDTKDIEETPKLEIKETAASETELSKTLVNDKESGGSENLGDAVLVRAKNVNELTVQGRGCSELRRPDTNKSVSVDDAREIVEAEPELKPQATEEADFDGSVSDGETDGLIFGSSEAAKQFIEQLEQGSGAQVSQDHLKRMDGQVVTEPDDEEDTDDEGEREELLNPSALAALLKAATGADADRGGFTITSQDGTRLFSVERPAGLGSSLRALRPNPQQTPLNLFAPTTTSESVDPEVTLSDEEKKTLEKLQQIRVKYLRVVHRLGLSPDDSVPAQVLYRLMLIMGRQGGRVYTMDAAKRTALQLESEEGNNLDLSLNILVLGKCGVGKSATINSIFGEEKAHMDAFQPATSGVREMAGYVNGVKLRVFDTPGLKCSVYEQSFNRSILSSVKRAIKKHPLDIVLYVDRLDSQTRDTNDMPLLKTITSCLGSSIWRMAIITLTHGASAPPDGPSGSPLSYDVCATQRSHVLQQTVSSAAGEVWMLNPSLMHPVALVENHPGCRKNREGQKVLPNGQSWRPRLLLLCYSLKILSEMNSISKTQDAFDNRKIFGFRGRSPPLPYLLSSMLQSRAHPKLPIEQGIDNGDSDIDLDYFSDTDQDEEDEYDQLPPFKPLRKAQIVKLSKEQRRAYFEEYDYRVKLLQKKQLKDELRRMKEMKNKGKDATVEYGYMEEDADSGAAAPVAVTLPDMVLPPSFDADNPAYRYRFLEPTSQFLARPVLDTHGWDHDCGYDGLNIEHGLAIANRFPASVTFQITKDKKDFTISMDSSVSAKRGENGSSMAGFDIQSLGKQLAYTIRGETKFKNLKKNKTSGGILITFLGDNVVPGAKLEDQITVGKQYALVGRAGAVRSERDIAYGANFELQRRELDFPISQAQSTFSMSLIKWRGDLALGFNSLFQFSIGRGSKVAIRAGLNNKLSGQISVKTSSSDHLSLALTALIPTVIAIYKKLQPGAPEQYLAY